MAYCQGRNSKLDATAHSHPICESDVAWENDTASSLREKIRKFLKITPEIEQTETGFKSELVSDSRAFHLKNQYFHERFAQIEADTPIDFEYSLFSIAFGPFQQLYHKSYSIFAKTYLPILLLVTINIGISAFLRLNFDSMLLTISLVLNGIGLFWGFGTAILNGKNYAHALYRQTGGNADTIPSSILSVVLGCLVFALVAGLSIWLGCFFAIVIIGG